MTLQLLGASALLLLTAHTSAAQLDKSDRLLIESVLHSQEGARSLPNERSPFRQQLLKEASSKKLEANSNYTALFKQAREDALAKAAILARLNGAPVSDAELKEAYETFKRGYAGKFEYKVKHFVMTSEQDALAILSELKKGVNFEKLAKLKSKDGASAARGGDAGWLTDCMMGCNYTEGLKVQAKEVGLGKLPKRPIVSPMGWFVSVVDVIRPLPVPSLAEAKSDLLREIRRQKFHKELQTLD